MTQRTTLIRTFVSRILALFLCVAGVSGCYRQVDVPTSTLPALLDANVRTVPYEGRDIHVTAGMQPKLNLRMRCGWFRAAFDSDCAASARLEDVSIEAGTLVLGGSEGRRIPLTEIDSASVGLRNWVPPDYEQHVAFGMTFVGPSLSVSYTLTIIPTPMLAFDLGGFAAPDNFGVYFVGMRVRPIRFGNTHLFVGALANAAVFGVDTEQRSAGGRVGIDIEFGSRMWLLSLEFDLLRRFNDSRPHVIGYNHDWLPIGGATVSVAF